MPFHAKEHCLSAGWAFSERLAPRHAHAAPRMASRQPSWRGPALQAWYVVVPRATLAVAVRGAGARARARDAAGASQE